MTRGLASWRYGRFEMRGRMTEVRKIKAHAGAVTALAIAIGLAAGLAVAWVLVEIVNPQSFHWTMDFRLPLGLVLGLVIALMSAAAATALIAAWHVLSRQQPFKPAAPRRPDPVSASSRCFLAA